MLFQVQGRNVPRPVTSFEEVGFPEYLMTTIRAQGFTEPTPIQCQAWPMALSGRDVVAIAQTGSGKTISFALPAMLHINAYVRVILVFFCNPNIPYPDNHCLLPVTGQLHLCLLQLASWRCKFNKNARNLGKPILLRFISACDSLAEQIHASEIQPSTAVLPRVPRSVTCNVESKL